MNLTGKSETGRRPHNEDSFCVSSENNRFYAVVSDGMGGHAAGETASRISVETLQDAFSKTEVIDERTLLTAFSDANDAVIYAADSDPVMYGMGATLVCAIPFPDHFLAANVGDSRLYLYHNGGLKQISHDHSYVAELVRRKIITPEEAKTHPRRNLITRAIGSEAKLKTDLFSVEWDKGDIILLCSDGLSGVVDDADIASVLQKAEFLDAACETLIETAYRQGSSDNITVVLIENTEDPE